MKREHSKDMLRKKVAQFIDAHGLFTAGDTVVVAVSGGADSVALLDILASLAELRLTLFIAHVNHLLRGVESDGDEAFVRHLGQRYGIPVETVRVDVKELARQQKRSLEDAGRVARYDFFARVARQCDADAVALAHHTGDQAETVLMRLLRGAGGSGLSAMAPKSVGNLVRPLLALTREEIETYLKHRGLPYRNDSTNSDTSLLRNRIRHELLPILGTYNPAVSDRLAATARALARDEEILEMITVAAFARHGRVGAARVAMDRAGCLAEPEGIRYRLYRRAILLARGGLERIASCHLEEIDRMLFSTRPHLDLSLPDGVRVSRSYDTLSFYQGDEIQIYDMAETVIHVPGVQTIPGGFRLTVEERTPHGAGLFASPCVAWFDAAAVPFPWQVRTFRPGDRIIPFGMTGTKKVKDLFIDEKVPRDIRRRIPLVFTGGRLVWVATLRVSAEAAVTDRTCRAIRAEVLEI